MFALSSVSVSGPADVAWQLHLAWPGSELVLLDDAGHGGGTFHDHITHALDGYRGVC